MGLVLSVHNLAHSHAQPITTQNGQVTISFPEEVDLQVLVDFTGKALNVRFLYGEELKGQKVELRPSPVELPKHSLLSFLASLLRVRELVMVEESPGLYRIVKSEQAQRSVSAILPADAVADPRSLRIVTQVFSVAGTDLKAIADKLNPFLSSAKGAIVALPESNRVLVTDYESRIAVLKELVDLLVAEGEEFEIRTLAVHADPATLSSQITSILAERQKLRGDSKPTVSIRGDVLPGSLVVVGTKSQIEQTIKLLDQLAPKGVDLTTRPYAPRYLSLDRAKRLIENVVLAPGSKLLAPASVFEEPQSGRLFVSAEPQTHEAIAAMFEAEDQPLPQTRRPLRTYRPKHRKATEVLTTVSQLLGQTVEFTVQESVPTSESPKSPPGPNRPPSTPGAGQVPPTPPAQEPMETGSPVARPMLRVQGADFVLTADDHTNSILAIGTREFHAQLSALIDDLDERRPQVLIEMTLVAITLSDSMDLGVELEALDLGDGWDYLLFSNFGLSTIDPTTGARTLTPGVGSNGVLIHPDETPVLFRALATKANARVISTPKLLVSDNAKGTLRNVDEAPFTSVNASDTVATTSFAGFESAGTTLNVTPHISQGDHVVLEYELSFSNFSGTSSAVGVPPPRTTNSFNSIVEVPDGYTLITGGLVVENKSDTVSEVPYLGRIPALGKLFQSSGKQNTKTKIFAFIRPTVLRDDEFEALKALSLQQAGEAGVDLSFEKGQLQWMR